MDLYSPWGHKKSDTTDRFSLVTLREPSLWTLNLSAICSEDLQERAWICEGEAVCSWGTLEGPTAGGCVLTTCPAAAATSFSLKWDLDGRTQWSNAVTIVHHRRRECADLLSASKQRGRWGEGWESKRIIVEWKNRWMDRYKWVIFTQILWEKWGGAAGNVWS